MSTSGSAAAPGRQRRVHFCLLGPSSTPIGGYKVVYEYANALVEQGVDVTVWHSNAFLAATAGIRGIWVAVRSWLVWWLRGQRRRWLSSGVEWFHLDARVKVRATGWFPALRLHAGDAAVATAIETTRFVGRQGRRASARSVSLIQHLETWAASLDYIRAAWAEVDERIVIAPWLAEECTAAGLSSILLPNALDGEQFPLGPRLVDRPLQVVSLLAPSRYKRPDVVIGTLEEVVRRRPEVSVVTFGQPSVPAVPSDVVKYTPDPRPAELRALYQTSRVYFCGSDAEGWHLPPAEATLSGAAVVSTDIGGVRASMAEDALYAPRGDVQTLATMIIEAIDRVDEAQRMTDHARERLLSRTYERNAGELLEALFPAGTAGRRSAG